MRAEVKLNGPLEKWNLPGLFELNGNSNHLAMILVGPENGVVKGIYVKHTHQHLIGKFAVFYADICKRVTGSVTLTFDS